MPNATGAHCRGYSHTQGWDVPPTARLGPERSHGAGAVSILRGALLEKEQKPREAINSLLLHTSASSTPASHGQGGSRSIPAISLPPSFSSQHPHLKPRGN